MGFEEFIAKFLDMLWLALATLTYVLIEIAITEIGALSIHKKTFWKKTEWFVLTTILFAILIFVLGNFLQDFFVNLLIPLKSWLLLTFIFFLALDILILTKFTKKRTWKFRLVKASIIVLSSTILFCIIMWVINLLSK